MLSLSKHEENPLKMLILTLSLSKGEGGRAHHLQC